MAHRFVIMQHVFGPPNSGGPTVALERLTVANTNGEFLFHQLRQASAAGGLNLELLASFRNQILRVKPDMIHVRGLGNEGFHGALAARLSGVRRILVSVHGTVRDLHFPGSSLKNAVVRDILEPATLRMASHIITVCHYAAERDFLLPYREKFVGVVHNGVDVPLHSRSLELPLRRRFGVADEDVLALSVSRITREKGYFCLAEALSKLPVMPRCLHVWIVGDGPDRAVIEANMPRRRDISVRFLGHCNDVASVLAEGDMFLFPSLHENLSNALLEGMSYGLPAIAFGVGGNSEVIARDTGVLIQRGDVNSFSSAIFNYVNDANLRRFHGRCAREHVKKNFSMQRMIDGMFGVYRRILKDESGDA